MADTKKNKEQFVQGVFENIANHYDRMNSVLSFFQHKRWRKFAMEQMAVKQNDSVIDVCCGTGDWTLALARASRTGKVIGLDFSPKMLAVGQQKISKEYRNHDQPIELIKGNAMELPYPDNTFDHATIGFALRNVPDLVQVLKEMQRVVKPGGQVVSLELSKPTQPMFRKVYYVYFQRILPLFGKLFAGKYQEYSWLPQSLLAFPGYEELKEIMLNEVGFAEVKVFPLTGGITALHIGYKKEDGIDEDVEKTTNRPGNDQI